MGTVGTLSSVMQYLILSVVGVSLATVSGQLVAYPNGAVAPYDPNNAAATKEHFAALNEAGAVVNPYFTHAQDLVVPAPLFYGKRSADAQHLVTYPNGAVAPFDPNVALATAQHYAGQWPGQHWGQMGQQLHWGRSPNAGHQQIFCHKHKQLVQQHPEHV